MNKNLYAPEEFWKNRYENSCLYKKIINGCGSENMKTGWKEKLFSIFQPNHLFGLNIKISCEIHDWLYVFSEHDGIEGKNSADRVFLNNMLRIIESNSSYEWLKKLRKWKARKYFDLVSVFGGPAYAAAQKEREKLEPKKDQVA